jgi:hypothetical protein
MAAYVHVTVLLRYGKYLPNRYFDLQLLCSLLLNGLLYYMFLFLIVEQSGASAYRTASLFPLTA